MLNIERRLELSPAEGQPGAAVTLLSERVTLELGAVGRGVFRIRADTPPEAGATGLYLAGIRGQGQVFPVLLGIVVERALLGDREWAVTLREPCAALDLHAGFALRHCTPREVLAALEERTGLAFLTPSAGTFLTRRLPHFLALGTCRAALEAMGPCWGLADAVWSGLPDGRVYWGPWAAAPWGVEPVTLDAALVLARDERALELPAMPALRPGILIEDTAAGSAIGANGAGPVLVQQVVFAGGRARVSWGEL